MTRLGLLIVIVAALLCCTTPQTPVKENTTPQTVSKEDMGAGKEFLIPLEELVEACIAALKDVGADYHDEPLVRMSEDSNSIFSATIAASSRSRVYGVMLGPGDDCDDCLGIILLIDDKVKPGSKAPYDEFWAALETRL